MQLTKQQKLAILDYVDYSTKSVLEDVEIVGSMHSEENDTELREAIEAFKNQCKKLLVYSVKTDTLDNFHMV